MGRVAGVVVGVQGATVGGEVVGDRRRGGAMVRREVVGDGRIWRVTVRGEVVGTQRSGEVIRHKGPLTSWLLLL